MTGISGDWMVAAQPVCAMLTAAGHRALFVGGCVRNALLDVAVADVDIATDAPPERVLHLAAAAGLKAVPTGIDHGTVTVIADHVPHEVTTLRRDVATDGRRAVVAFTDDLAEDAARRDFTMNALYATPDGHVIDPLGGLPDLVARRVRFVGDPVARITEDYLRILRFFRFHAVYGDPAAGLDADGLAACAAHADGIDRLSRERIGAEMRKLLSAPDPAPSVAAMAQAGVLRHVLPGADARWLAPLVHLEGAEVPRWLRRLAALGGEEAAERLRLSRSDAAALAAIRSAALSDAAAVELGYRLGAERAGDAILVRAVLMETAPPETWGEEVARGARAVFPVRAADLMPGLEGAALGARLKALENRWIASGLVLKREDLLA
ncbi:CCA tRNA nucleotidyltransferase [Aliigemmobacter aestuarii]|uniref:CCA tRNA nucleotidyltransferase n=1 Tax=Aliigemmobacter aestuarii TaxID=1445661 RepID=A0A4S3MSK4_9RHOB|nr:CCA tRNA nucleotidyltransferase [Gemmobacter aestuarii]THD85457.1 CCA tRNA nucleotidyltransferase [Gemmobacter aestuarii]